jgi:putative membrane protein
LAWEGYKDASAGKSFNPQIFLEFSMLLCLRGIDIYLVSSSGSIFLCHTQNETISLLHRIVMLIWLSWGFTGFFRPQHKVRYAHCFVLVIPILLILLPQ